MEPVDRNARVLADGSPVTADHRLINPLTGQQKAYVVLSVAERAKGFVRPVRNTYTHLGRLGGIEKTEPPHYGPNQVRSGGCGADTSMGEAIAQTYARDPEFYAGTFCSRCLKHLPLDEFVWKGTDQQVGS